MTTLCESPAKECHGVVEEDSVIFISHLKLTSPTSLHLIKRKRSEKFLAPAAVTGLLENLSCKYGIEVFLNGSGRVVNDLI